MTTSTRAKQLPQPPADWSYQPPEKKATWIAYDRRDRDIARDTGETIPFRASVQVREYATVLVKDLKINESEARGERFVYASVKFDASSVGVENFTHDFSANAAESPALEVLKVAHQRQEPVCLVLENIRRAKTKKGSQPIELTAPIWQLMGASEPGGTGSPQEALGNTRGVVAAVAPAANPGALVFSHECVTDPAEWATMRRNHDDTRAPAGWMKYAGGITRVTGAPGAAGGGTIDIAALAAQLAPMLANTTAAPPTGTGATPASPVQRRSGEAQPWYATNYDGSLNLSSYVVRHERIAFSEATKLLADRGNTDLSVTWKVADMLLWAADATQSHVAGGADRSEGSHFEAQEWVKFVVTSIPGHELPADETTWRDWVKGVAASARDLYQAAATRAGANAGANYQAPTTSSGPQDQQCEQESATAATPPAQPAQAPATVADDPALVQRYRSLLAATNMTEHEANVRPLLAVKFDGASTLETIPAASFEPVLSGWEAAASTFVDEGRAAFMATQQG